MSEDSHVCPTCGRHYVGYFCPQCGQSSKIGRYSFKNAFLLYLDVWGLGNCGMFCTLSLLVNTGLNTKVTMFVPIIPLKQLSGYGYIRCFLMYTIAIALIIVLLLIIIFGVVYTVYRQ